MTAKLTEFFQTLVEGTRSGTFKWSETAEPGVYRLMLDNGLVRISHCGPTAVGSTVLDARGTVIHDVQVPRREGEPLTALYDLVDGHIQEGALDELLAEVRTKVQTDGRQVPAGRR